MGIEQVMEDVAKKEWVPSRNELEANIKVSHNWITAVNSGTFHGAASLHIATLLDFLQKQHDAAVAQYEKQSAGHPEWAKPVPTHEEHVEANIELRKSMGLMK